MNEVEKMYENAGVEADYDYFTFFDDKVHKIGRTMHLCKEELKHWLENYQKDYVAIKVIRVDKVYPPFTAEKQIKIMELLGEVHAFFDADKTNFACITNYRIEKGIIKGYEGKGGSVSEALASLVNDLWQDLTDVEKAEIKNILESEVRE